MRRKVVNVEHQVNTGTRSSKVDGLQRQLDSLEKDFKDFTAYQQSAGSKLQSSVEMRDQPWKCVACKSLLGWYNEGKDIIRIRYKQQTIFARIGEGGFIQSICVSCSEPNTLDFVSSDEANEEVE